MVMRSPCAGAALDPPLWTIVPNKALSLSLSLSMYYNNELLFVLFFSHKGTVAVYVTRVNAFSGGTLARAQSEGLRYLSTEFG